MAVVAVSSRLVSGIIAQRPAVAPKRATHAARSTETQATRSVRQTLVLQPVHARLGVHSRMKKLAVEILTVVNNSDAGAAEDKVGRPPSHTLMFTELSYCSPNVH
jgi:hypothetical protein